MHTLAIPRRVTAATMGSERWKPFPAIAFAAGAGLLVCSVANSLSRATEAPSPFIYWAGILLIAMPIFFRLTSREASPGERLALVCLLGLTLYGVKLVRDAPIFTFSDELIHAYNSNLISQHDRLFQANPVLDVSRYYPGLEGATSALRSLTGLSSYGAGAIIVGAARLTLMSALFALFWRVSGSDRIAGIGAALFAGNFNFLFWSAQYSYESMALPLMIIVLFAIVELELAQRAARGVWRMLALIAIAAVVVTHHISSYAVAASLLALSVAAAFVRSTPKPPNPWPLAAVAIGLTTFWLFVIASSTVGYLSPVLSEALSATLNTAGGEAPARELFQGATPSTVGPTPALARGIALLAILMLAAALPFGLRTIWRRYRTQPIALIFAGAAVGFFAVLGLRLVPDAWETANRASGFLFVGLAFVVACAGIEAWRPRAVPWLGRTLTVGGLGVVLVGGAITGWPWDSQLSQPVRVEAAGGGTISSPPLSLAEWAKENVDEGDFAALAADSRLLLDPGDKFVLTDYTSAIIEIIPDVDLGSWAVPLLREHDVRFVVANQRVVANDGIRGYYFSVQDSRRNVLLPRSAITKFEAVPGVDRVFDSGSIVVWDIAAKPRRVGPDSTEGAQ